METVAVGILVTEATDQSFWAGLVAAAGFAPSAVLGPFGGAIADRHSRKRTLLLTMTVQTLLATALFALALRGEPSPGVVTLLVLGTGCANAIGFPSYQAILPDLVPADDLVGAVGLSSAQWNLGRIIGPALAGIVIGLGGDRWGYSLAFGINAVSFLAVIFVIASLRLPRPDVVDVPEPILRSIRGGFQFCLKEPGLRGVVTFMSINSLLAAPFIALISPMALKVLDAGKGGVSALVAAQGVGAVVMALALGPLAGKFGPRRLLSVVLWLLPIALAAYALAPSIATAVLLIFFVGAFYLGNLSSFTSIAQLRTPAVLRGRVMSILMVLLGALYPLGSVVQGWLSDRFGQRQTAFTAALLTLALVAVVRATRPGYLKALDEPVTLGDSGATKMATR